MSAYFISLFESISDRPKLEEYWAKISATFADHDVKILAGYTRFKMVEGDSPLGAVILEFPSFEEAEAWYDGAAYRAIRHLRTESSKSSGMILDSGMTPPTQRML